MMNEAQALVAYGLQEGEAPERERRRVSPVINGEDEYVATGAVETVNYFGSYAALAARQNALIGSYTQRYTSTLSRNMQGVWSLRVEVADYVKRVKESTDTDDPTGGGDSGGDGGGSDAAADSSGSMSISCEAVAEPLLTNPMFKGLNNCSDDVAEALSIARNGGRLSSKMRSSSGQETTVGAVLRSNNLAMRAFKFFATGCYEYYVPHTRCTVRRMVRRVGDAGNGKTGSVATPPGRPKAPSGQKWLLMGEGYEQTGRVIYHTQVYEAGNWNAALYGGK